MLVWQIAKWPVLFLLVMLIVAMLYYATPNIQQPKFRWISVGAGLAIVIWVLASAAFALYVANFGSYDKTYGSLAGAVVTLLWLWITNLALLLGAEIDSELERGRELQAGIPAEEELRLPARDTSGIKKSQDKAEKYLELGRQIRADADPDGEIAAEYGVIEAGALVHEGADRSSNAEAPRATDETTTHETGDPVSDDQASDETTTDDNGYERERPTAPPKGQVVSSAGTSPGTSTTGKALAAAGVLGVAVAVVRNLRS